MDDIILTGSAFAAILQVIQALTTKFDITDLGSLHYFLGIQITHTSTRLFLSQTKYVEELLLKSKMVNAKPCLPCHGLLKEDGEPYPNPTVYSSIVGALQYLTFTRPNIAFFVHQVYQFM